MNLALSSWSFHTLFYQGKLTLLDVPAYAAQLGFAQVELNDFMLPAPRWSRLRGPLLKTFNPHAPRELWRYTDDNLRRVRLALVKAKVSCLSWTLETDFTVSKAAWAAQLGYLGWGVKAASLLDAKIIRIILGGEEKPSARPLPALISQRLTAMAQTYPAFKFVVENHWGLSTDVDLFLEIMSQVRAPNCGVCFDPANLPTEHRPRHWEQLARRATHFHFKTIAFDEQGAETTLAYDYLMPLLKQVGYTGVAILEFEGDGEALPAIRRSQALFDRCQ